MGLGFEHHFLYLEINPKVKVLQNKSKMEKDRVSPHLLRSTHVLTLWVPQLVALMMTVTVMMMKYCLAIFPPQGD